MVLIKYMLPRRGEKLTYHQSVALTGERESVNISQLRTFVAVIESGTFSEAARVLGISQPAVTMQMQALEAELGATLLDRRYRRVDLTEAGRLLLPRAQQILAELDETREAIEGLSGTVTGHLVLAASTTPGVYVLPRLLGSFVAAYPEVGVTLNVHDTAEVVSAVEAGEAQLGVTGGTVRGARATFEEIGVDELVVIASPDSPLASRRSVKLTELADQTWVMRESGSATRQSGEKMLREAGLNPDDLRVAIELGTGESIVSAVEGGLGIAIVSEYVAEKAVALGTVKVVPAEGTPAIRPLFVVHPRGMLSRAAEAFLEHLRQHMGEGA
jgi:DNA-binding transcriptional LysR family regulator